MSSVQLLDRTRKIGKLLHNNSSSKVVFNDICSVMREIVSSNVLVISKKGKVLGVCNFSGEQGGQEIIHELIKNDVGGFIDPMLNERLLSVLSTKENVNLATLGFENPNVCAFAAIVALRMIDQKLDEELTEYHKDQNIEELADLMEVIYAAAIARGYTIEQLEQVRADKAKKRGIEFDATLVVGY